MMGLVNFWVFFTFCLTSSFSQEFRKFPGPGSILRQGTKKVPFGETGSLRNERKDFDGHLDQAVLHRSVRGERPPGESFPRGPRFGFIATAEKKTTSGPIPVINPETLTGSSVGRFQAPGIHSQTFNIGILSHRTHGIGGKNGVTLKDSKIGSEKLEKGFSGSLNPNTREVAQAFQEIDLNGLSFTGSSGDLEGLGVDNFKSAKAQGFDTNDLRNIGFSLRNQKSNLDNVDLKIPINIQGGLTDLDLTGIDPKEIGFDIGDPILSQAGAESVGDVLKDLDLAGIGPQDIHGTVESTRTPGLSHFGPLNIGEQFREGTFSNPSLKNTNANLMDITKPGVFLDHTNKVGTFQQGGVDRPFKIDRESALQRHSTPVNGRLQQINFKPKLGENKDIKPNLRNQLFNSPLVDHSVDYNKNLFSQNSQGSVKKPHRIISHGTINIGISHNTDKIPSEYHTFTPSKKFSRPYKATTSYYHTNKNLAHGHQSFNIGSVDIE